MFAFFYTLVAYMLLSGLGESGMLLGDGPADPARTIVGFAGILGVVWVAGNLHSRARLASLRGRRWRAGSLAGLGYAMLQLAGYAALLLVFDWDGLFRGVAIGGPDAGPFAGMSLWSMPIVGDLIGLAPAFLIAAVALLPRYDLDRLLQPAIGTRLGYVRSQLGWLVLPLPLLIAIDLIGDGLLWLEFASPAWEGLIVAMPTLSVIAQLVPLVGVLLVAPYLFRLGIASSPLRDPDLLARFRRLEEKAGVRIGMIRIWHLGRVVNAMVLGLVGRLRLIMLTEGLLKQFPRGEIEAIYAHELGHAKHGHLWLFFGSMIAVLLAMVAIVQPGIHAIGEAQGWSIDQTSTAITAVVGLSPFLILGLLVTVVSQTNERQADLHASRVADDPLDIGRALLRISAIYGGAMLHRPSPTHGSIATRVRFIVRNDADPTIGQRFERRARWLHRGITVAILGVLGWFGVVTGFDAWQAAPTVEGFRVLVPEGAGLIPPFADREFAPDPADPTAPDSQEQSVLVRTDLKQRIAALESIIAAYEPSGGAGRVARVRYFRAEMERALADLYPPGTSMQETWRAAAIGSYRQALADAPIGFPVGYRLRIRRWLDTLSSPAASADSVAEGPRPSPSSGVPAG